MFAKSALREAHLIAMGANTPGNPTIPTGIPNKLGTTPPAPWTITDNPDGSITVS